MKVFKQVDREQWQAWINQAIAEAKKGNLPRYIPLLNHENPKDYSLLVTRLEGEVFSSGNLLKTFPLMSVIKPFLFLYFLSQQGQEWVFGYVDKFLAAHDSSIYNANFSNALAAAFDSVTPQHVKGYFSCAHFAVAGLPFVPYMGQQ